MQKYKYDTCMTCSQNCVPPPNGNIKIEYIFAFLCAFKIFFPLYVIDLKFGLIIIYLFFLVRWFVIYLS